MEMIHKNKYDDCLVILSYLTCTGPVRGIVIEITYQITF